MKLPKDVNILGTKYNIVYCDKPCDVDAFQREALWGQIDYWTRTIRIYIANRGGDDVWKTIFHEVIHGITNELKIDFCKQNDTEKVTDLLATGFYDVITRNGWMA